MTESGKTMNVGDIERVVSGLAGGALVVWGLRRRSLGGLIVAAAGGEMIRRGVSGHCAVYEWLGRNTAQSGPIEIESAVTIDQPAVIVEFREAGRVEAAQGGARGRHQPAVADAHRDVAG